LPAASCGLPAGLGGPPSNACAGRRAPCGVRRPSWPCSGWGLPSRPSHLGRWWSLTPPFHPYRPVAEATTGGLLSVALSRGSPRVGVTHHPALWSPDFPRRSGFPDRRGRPAGSSAVIVSLRERAPTCDCSNRASCRRGLITLNQWTDTRKRSGEPQDQWTPAQPHGPDLTGWLSTVRRDAPIHHG
jgi:hypothetical protein